MKRGLALLVISTLYHLLLSPYRIKAQAPAGAQAPVGHGGDRKPVPPGQGTFKAPALESALEDMPVESDNHVYVT